MHSLGIVQWNSTRRDHPGNPVGVFGSGPVKVSPGFLLENDPRLYINLVLRSK